MHKTLLCGVAAMAMMAAAVSAGAEDGAWQFKLTPYVWAMGLKGDVGARNMTVPVDVTFADVVKSLDLAGMLAAEANNGTWGILCDGLYSKLSDDTDTQLGKFRVKVEQVIVQASAFYRIHPARQTSLDLGLGGRYIGAKTEIDVPSDVADLSQSKGWADPLVIARLRQQITEKLFAVLGGDIGGFGVSSTLTWQLTAAAGYAFNDTVSMLLGYRYLDYNYKDNGFTYDVGSSGLAIGLQFNL